MVGACDTPNGNWASGNLRYISILNLRCLLWDFKFFFITEALFQFCQRHCSVKKRMRYLLSVWRQKKKGGTGLILIALLPVIILSQITLKHRFFLRWLKDSQLCEESGMAESELNVDSLIARLLEGELPGADRYRHPCKICRSRSSLFYPEDSSRSIRNEEFKTTAMIADCFLFRV